jgi:hypothetical protein
MDELITRADHGRAGGLRALGVTAQLDLIRFRRLVVVAQNLAVDTDGNPVPWSPPLTAFLEALLLFAEAFDSTGGFRLLRIARPPILFYGLYGLRSVDPAEDRLLNIILQRNLMADRLDCFLDCGCSGDALICQVVLDKILYDTDRAIDYYAIGTENFGTPERRASAYGLLIETFAAQSGTGFKSSKCQDLNSAVKVDLFGDGEILDKLEGLLMPKPDFGELFESNDSKTKGAFHDLLRQELCLQRDNEKRWRNLVATMAPDCAGFDAVFAKLDSVLSDTLGRLTPAEECPAIDILIPPHIEVSQGSSQLAFR